ncbi:MAG: GerAB/ArcD/ProY family transporter [Clostridiales bacterium]|nr:GerAB/ArcD/ProY family transporter [Clostridiales bacterium]
MTDTKTKNKESMAQDKSQKPTETKQSTGVQLVVVVFILSLATKMFLLPIFLIQTAGRDGYIVLSLEAGFDLVMLGILLAAIWLSKDKTFFELLECVIGKIGAKITVALVALFLFFKLNIAAAETLTFYSDNVFADFDSCFMIIVLLIFLAAVANHTLRSLCRLNEIIMPVVAIGIIILMTIVLATGFDFANIFPALRNGGVFKNSLLHNVAWLGDFTPLVLFIGRTKTSRRAVGIAAASGAVGSAVAVFFSIVMCAAFGNIPHLANGRTNISSILQFSIGNVYGRIDLLSCIFWSVAAFVETALFFYATCRCIEYVIGKNAHFWVGISLCVALYFIQIFALTDPTIFSTVVSNPATSIMIPIFSAVIPIIALVCAAVVKKRDSKSKAAPPSEDDSVNDNANEKSGESEVGA